MKQVEDIYKTFLDDCHAKNLKRQLCAIEPEFPCNIKVDGVSYVNFASNDYLGLSQHKDLKDASAEWAQKYGAGNAASRLVTGNLVEFHKIEAKIAKLKGSEAALILASGFQANAAVLQALFDKSILGLTPYIVSDRLNHASMHFGCKAAGVSEKRYRHLDLTHAEQLLKATPTGTASFLMTETVFSMDGDIAPMKELKALCETYGAMLIADDAHGFGVLGANGAGLALQADLTIGTFSKAMGSFGAYVAGSKVMIDYLIQRCGGLIYSTALPPATLGAINSALDLLPTLNAERKKVKLLASQFRGEMEGFGFDTGASETQIVPLIVGEAEAALALSDYLKSQGFWVTAIRPPTVPKGTARLRFAFSSAHEQKDLDRLIAALKTYEPAS